MLLFKMPKESESTEPKSRESLAMAEEKWNKKETPVTKKTKEDSRFFKPPVKPFPSDKVFKDTVNVNR